MIKIGIEVSRKKLQNELLDNPGRYFFILSEGGRAALCIQTCDFQGENIKTHIIDGFALNEKGELSSIFDEGINYSILNGYDGKCSSERRGYTISTDIEQILCRLPDMMDWIISSILTRDRNLVIYPSVINP